jgi:hypothetical protein
MEHLQHLLWSGEGQENINPASQNSLLQRLHCIPETTSSMIHYISPKMINILLMQFPKGVAISK